MAKLLVLGPIIGFAIGGIGSWAMNKIDARMAIREEHQALYGVGLVLASYAGAVAVGGDGFLASFAAGVAVVVLNQSLCECFLDFGEIASEMAMLLAFVLFGAVLSGILGSVAVGPALILAVLALVLSRAKLSWEARAFVSWFGPRGLNSLLLALLVVQAGIPGSELLLATIGVVVLASVTIHGASATPVSAWYGRRASREILEEEKEATVAGLFGQHAGEVPRVSVDELAELMSGTNPPVILDVRARASYDHDGSQIPGSVRVLPDQILEWAADLPEDRMVVAYCA